MTLANRIIGSCLLLFSIAVWLYANTFPEAKGTVPGSGFFPQLISVVLGVLSIALLLKREDESSVTFLKGKKALIFGLGIFSLLIYVVLVELIGFLVMTVLFSSVWMWLMEVRKVKTIILTSVIVGISITLVFEYLLNVPIPHGLLY